MVLGFNLRDTLRNKRDINTVIERNDRLEQVIDLVNEKYVDSLNTNVLYHDAVTGILSHLDPHTTYIPADEVASANQDLNGGFFGIGVEFSIVHDTIQVTSVVDNGPAQRAGIDIGDQLIKVDDSVVAGKNISSERIITLLKGKQHTRVYLTLKQPVSPVARQVAIVRDIVPIYSVEAWLMIDNTTGYIKINRFSATTYDEFVKALKKLQAFGMKELVIDLRDNPGGYLDAATMIADELLSNDKLIVYTKGLHSPRTDYKAQENGLFENGRLAVLVDENSASASEILAGAVQDWDRGIIVGRRSFGKGLVQEQYELPDGAELRLTIAKYYTPSGRCIQRSFAKGKAAYEKDFEARFENGELTSADTSGAADTTRYYTAGRRIVYGGGGIKPDVYVPYDTLHFSPALLSMVYSQEMKEIIWDYYIHNRASLKFRNVADFDEKFNAQKVLIQKYLSSIKLPKQKKVLQNIIKEPESNEHLERQVKAQLARFIYRDNGFYAITAKDDNVVQDALRTLHSDAYLKLILR